MFEFIKEKERSENQKGFITMCVNRLTKLENWNEWRLSSSIRKEYAIILNGPRLFKKVSCLKVYGPVQNVNFY